jgi:hypothetical protein
MKSLLEKKEKVTIQRSITMDDPKTIIHVMTVQLVFCQMHIVIENRKETY